MSKTIGILGGIGPESSAVFYEKFISSFKEKFHPVNNIEFPRIIINSIPAPELTSGENEQKLGVYIEGIKFLEKESDFIVVVCNTAFIYLNYFNTKINKPILDISSNVKNRLGENRILFLASPNSIEEKLFDLSGDKIIQLQSTEKQKMGEIINQYNAGNISQEQKVWLVSLIDKYYNQAEYILVACTELSLILNDWKDIKKIDTFDLLIKETLNKYASISKN